MSQSNLELINNKKTTKDILQLMCAEAGLPKSGKKEDIVKRLNHYYEPKEKSPNVTITDFSQEEKKPKKVIKDDSEEKTEELTREALSGKLTKAKLEKWCSENKLPKTGTKDELIKRLESFLNGEIIKKSPKKKVEIEEPPVLKNFVNNDEFPIIKNEFGNFINKETNLVIDRISNLIVGFQLPTGEVRELTEEDIEICKKFKVFWQNPKNLNLFKGIEDIKIEDVSYEDEEDFDEDDFGEEDVEDIDDDN